MEMKLQSNMKNILEEVNGTRYHCKESNNLNNQNII